MMIISEDCLAALAEKNQKFGSDMLYILGGLAAIGPQGIKAGANTPFDPVAWAKRVVDYGIHYNEVWWQKANAGSTIHIWSNFTQDDLQDLYKGVLGMAYYSQSCLFWTTAGVVQAAKSCWLGLDHFGPHTKAQAKLKLYMPGTPYTKGKHINMFESDSTSSYTLKWPSQKLLGLRMLQNWASGWGLQVLPVMASVGRKWLDSDRSLVTSTTREWSSPHHKWMGEFPVFCRPCPVRPRHGFVDSRPINNMDEFVKLVEETLAADPEGYVMVTPCYQEVPLSAIWTPHMLTIGAGNDGATAGKSTTNFPLSGQLYEMGIDIIKDAGIGPDEDPFVEAILSRGSSYNSYISWILTQLRAGPKGQVNMLADYIPSRVEVKSIMRPNNRSLLEWEAECKAVAGREGVVIHHPGGSPLDHYFVHARTCSIPVITTFEPRIGDTLEPIEGPPPLDVDAVMIGLAASDQFDFPTNPDGVDFQRLARSAAHLMLMGLHYNGLFSGDQARWIGMSAGLMIKLGSMALRGEARHLGGDSTCKPSRDAVYKRYANRSLTYHQTRIDNLLHIFRYGRWQGSFGGTKWALCAAALKPLFVAVQTFSADPNTDTLGGLIRALNMAVNQAHNNGWWMNKFTDAAVFTSIPKGSMSAALIAAESIYALEQIYRTIPASVVEKKRQSWSKWVDGGRKLTVNGGQFFFSPYVGAVEVKLKSRLLKGRMQPITIPTSRLTKHLNNLMMGRLEVKSIDGRLSVVFSAATDPQNPDTTPPTVVWQEEPLIVKDQLTPGA